VSLTLHSRAAPKWRGLHRPISTAIVRHFP
jgi:hypothetical protein